MQLSQENNIPVQYFIYESYGVSELYRTSIYTRIHYIGTVNDQYKHLQGS